MLAARIVNSVVGDPAERTQLGPCAAGAQFRIESLRVQNYRALRDFALDDITPLTVLVGPNGSGKSTVLDVFAFLSDSFTLGLRHAWDKRGRLRGVRSSGATGPVVIELRYREHPAQEPSTYRLVIDENDGSPMVLEESLRRRRAPNRKRSDTLLSFKGGKGWAIADLDRERRVRRVRESLDDTAMLAARVLGQLARHPRLAALRRFVTHWHVSRLSAREAGGPMRLSNPLTAHGPTPPSLVVVEEPGASRHPRLLPDLAEEYRAAAERSQVLLSTHSPLFLDPMRPEEVRALYRDERGDTRAMCASDARGVKEALRAGAQLGQLWLEGRFGVGDGPGARAGRARPGRPSRAASAARPVEERT